MGGLQGANFLALADAVARDKGIDCEHVLEAMEEAMGKAAQARYGQDYDIRARIHRKTGDVILSRYLEVVEEENMGEEEARHTRIPLRHARSQKPDAKVGDFLIDELTPTDFGRIAAQMGKHVVLQKIREAERTQQCEDYLKRVGTIVSGVVKRLESGHVLVDLGGAEAIILREELIPRERFRRGDRVRAYLYEVRPEVGGAQIFLSRTHPQFMVKLFAQEVPEIYDRIIEIKDVARDPGSRAKIGVVSHDSSLNPVGACVGLRGSRVQAVVTELQGERVDIIPWKPDIATYVVNALAPAEVLKVVLDEDSRALEVVVPEEQLSRAIGRRGQNVRLVSILTGYDISILTEEEEAKKREEEIQEKSARFVEVLDVESMIGRLLVEEGFSSLEEVAYIPLEELASIDGFDEDVAVELKRRAQVALDEKEAALDASLKGSGVEEALISLKGMTKEWAVCLGEQGVVTLNDFADLSLDELTDEENGLLRSLKPPHAMMEQLIMAARQEAGWFESAESSS